MLKKLIKYDLIWINKLMIVYFVIAFVLSISTRILGYFDTSFMGKLIYTIVRGFAISAYVSCLITCVMRIWVRFRNNTYKDESYLSNTLPVSKCTMYNSKILSSIISLLMSLLVIIVCIGIIFLNKSTIEALKNIFSNKDFVFIFISLVFTVILEMIYMTYCGIIGILFGHKSNNLRTAKSIIIGIVLYFVMQSILLSIIYALGLLNDSMNTLFTYTMPLDILPAVKILVISANTIYLVFIVAMYLIGKRTFKKGINVD